ncbi:MAG: redoxin domain-containing protein [Planctomycetota bacterium]|nr:redoxin domain-containing protein [Planctomycetota bacterium]
MRFHFLLVAAVLIGLLGCGDEKSQSKTVADSSKTGSQDNTAIENKTISDAGKTLAGPADPTNPPVASVALADVPKVLSEANQLASRGDLNGALQKVESALAVAPKENSGLLLATQLAAGAGMQAAQAGDRKTSNPLFIKSAEFLDRLASSANSDGIVKALGNQVYYNAGCAYAMAGESQKAIEALKKAVAAGSDDADHFEQDADLASIRDTPEFKDVVASIRKKDQFAFDFSLKDLEGNTVSLAGLKGKVVIADIWGTWCPPCRKEIPHFIDLQKEHGEAGLQIVGLNFKPSGDGEDINTVKKFAEEFGINYPCLIGDQSVIRQVPNLQGFPTTLFIDRNGKVRKKVVGYHSIEKLQEIIKPLLAENAGT